jgi:hypothetical protein
MFLSVLVYTVTLPLLISTVIYKPATNNLDAQQQGYILLASAHIVHIWTCGVANRSKAYIFPQYFSSKLLPAIMK